MSNSLFRRSANRLAVYFKDYGFIAVATDQDDRPVFETAPPEKIGDDAIIFVEGQLRKARLLKSDGHFFDGTYLVDMGPA